MKKKIYIFRKTKYSIYGKGQNVNLKVNIEEMSMNNEICNIDQ